MTLAKTQPNRRSENPPSSTMLRADISQHVAIKTALERIFGRRAWLDLKECTSITIWKKYAAKLLQATQIAIEETIQIRDDDWFSEICQHLDRGLEIARGAKSVDELFSGLSATLMKVVFLQIGTLPDRCSATKITLDRSNWRLDTFRTVQYVQGKGQLEGLFWSKQQKLVGVEKQMKVWNQYRTSRTKVPYSKWCAEHKI